MAEAKVVGFKKLKRTRKDVLEEGIRRFKDFRDGGCKQTGTKGKPDSQLFGFLYAQTGGDPCRTGCAWFDGCEYAKALFPAGVRPQRTEPQGPTNRELADKLGVSKRAVSKLRTLGRLEKALKLRGAARDSYLRTLGFKA